MDSNSPQPIKAKHFAKGSHHSKEIFVELLCKYRVILTKNVSSAKRRKQIAIKAMSRELYDLTGEFLTTKQLLKKIYNFKTKIKMKKDSIKPGDKEFPFKFWEQRLSNLFEEERKKNNSSDDNGFDDEYKEDCTLDEKEDEKKIPDEEINEKIFCKEQNNITGLFVESTSSQNVDLNFQKSFKKSKDNKSNLHETEETKNLSNRKLLRLVLLEQLALIRDQRELLKSTNQIT